jgi:hypothetical protein
VRVLKYDDVDAASTLVEETDMVSYWPQEIMITIRGDNKAGVSTFRSTSHAPAIMRRLSLGLQYLKSTTFSHDEIHPWKKGRKAPSTTRGRLAARCGYNCYLRLAHLKPWAHTLDRRMSGLGCPKSPLARHAFLPNCLHSADYLPPADY